MLIFFKTAVLLIALIAFLVALAYVVIYVKYKFILNIKTKTIHLQKPILTADDTIQRKPITDNPLLQNLILHESFLRKAAYKNTLIKTTEAFFNDTDMQSDYFLIVVYHKKTNTPLLTARYYFDKALIAKYIKGEEDKPPVLNLDKFAHNQIFLVDRMSANNHNKIYRQHRNYIHLLFYLQLFIYNKNCKFIAMARKQKLEKLLTKYIRLGLTIVGTTKHQGKEHWVLLGDLQKNYANTKHTTLINIFLLTKNFLLKFKIR
ncbi:MAG TPA: hypothetical protein VK835_03970 [Bacteroidia bacterium]|jgi:hypothetical protein|nr:hypothetical protein [Bacteroidia bacterium]